MPYIRKSKRDYLSKTAKVIKKYIYSFLCYEDKRNTYKILESEKPIRPSFDLGDINCYYKSMLNKDIPPIINFFKHENWYITEYLGVKNIIRSLARLLIIKYSCKTNTKVFIRCKDCNKFLRVPFIHNGRDRYGNLIMVIKLYRHRNDNKHEAYRHEITIRHNHLIKDIDEWDRICILHHVEGDIYDNLEHPVYDRELF